MLEVHARRDARASIFLSMLSQVSRRSMKSEVGCGMLSCASACRVENGLSTAAAAISFVSICSKLIFSDASCIHMVLRRLQHEEWVALSGSLRDIGLCHAWQSFVTLRHSEDRGV